MNFFFSYLSSFFFFFLYLLVSCFCTQPSNMCAEMSWQEESLKKKEKQEGGNQNDLCI